MEQETLKCCCVYYVRNKRRPDASGTQSLEFSSELPQETGKAAGCEDKGLTEQPCREEGGRKGGGGCSGSELRNGFYIRREEEVGSAALQEIQVAAKLTCKAQMCGGTWRKACGIGPDQLVSPALDPLNVEIRTNGPVQLRLATRPQAPCAIAATRISCQHTLLTTTASTSQRGPRWARGPRDTPPPETRGGEPGGQLGPSEVQAQPKWHVGDLRNLRKTSESEPLGGTRTDNQNNGPQKRRSSARRRG